MYEKLEFKLIQLLIHLNSCNSQSLENEGIQMSNLKPLGPNEHTLENLGTKRYFPVIFNSSNFPKKALGFVWEAKI